jgi:lipid II:glycine glycyltransferase (peptidoglycan interpeptide bridge formation enzyme)
MSKIETPRDLRKKLSRSTQSRNALKNKHRQTQYEIKKLNNCLSAMTASRNKWRLECKENKTLIKKLEKELSEVSQNRDELIAKVENIDSSNSKKNIKLIS